jgi:hypothetical protein
MPKPSCLRRYVLGSFATVLIAGCGGGAPSVDERAEGSIAYTTVPSNGPVCVAVVGAAGGERPRLLGCDPGYIGSLRWDDDGFVRVAVQTDEGGEQEDVIDPQSGEVVARVDGIGIGPARSRSDGAMLFPRVQDGRAEVVAALPDGTEQVVMTADGVRGFRTATWSPDGEWAAAVDGEGRLMVTPVADGDSRVLARDVNEPAWHQARRDP